MVKRLLPFLFLLLGSPVLAEPLSTYLVEPCRLVDTRVIQAPLLGTNYRFWRAKGYCGISDDARAAIFNVVVVGATSEGHITVWDGSDFPAFPNIPPVSTLNFGPGSATANNVTTRLRPTIGPPTGPEDNTDFVVFSYMPELDSGSGLFHTAHIIIDVVGYLK